MFPLSLTLLACAALSVSLVYFGMIPYALLFQIFIFSITGIVVGVVLAVFYFYRTWPSEELCPYSYRSMEESPSLEPSNARASVRTANPSPQKAKTLNVDPPSREQLQQLKEVLGISEGSLQFKKRGQGIYHVVYNEEKHHWTHLGSWIQLREKLGLERAVE